MKQTTDIPWTAKLKRVMGCTSTPSQWLQFLVFD